MTRFLLIGKGSIAKTLLSIIDTLGEKYDIVTCDLKEDGIRGQDYIIQHHDEFDAVINLTDDRVRSIMELCERYRLRYIDAGYEDENEVFAENYLKLTGTGSGNGTEGRAENGNGVKERTRSGIENRNETENRIESGTETARLLGFGMNPGVVELFPYLVERTKPYIACVFETDLPEPCDSSDHSIYATWAPVTYYDEALVLNSFLSTKYADCVYIDESKRYNIELNTLDGTYRYHIVPHEEVFSIQAADRLCMGSAFVFHAPEPLQDYMLQFKGRDALEIARNIPVNNHITGTERVGILLYDGTDNLRYIVNASDHAACCRRYGHNATCYQTACGVYIAMQLLPLLPDGTTMTFTKAAERYTEEILAILNKLDFKIDVCDNYMSREQFEKKLLPLFGKEVEDFFIGNRLLR